MCPPGTDQTTRLSQKWSIMVPALEEQYDLGSLTTAGSYGFHPATFLRAKQKETSWDAFDKLAKHERPEQPKFKLLAHVRMCRPQAVKSSAIERLPAELFGMLFEEPSLSTRDTIALGLASETLWLHLVAYLSRLSCKAPWAGTPLLCSGTYLTSMPQAIHDLHPELKDDEAAFLNRTSTLRGTVGSPCRGICPARLFNWDARDRFTDRSKGSFAQQVFHAFHEVAKQDEVCPADLSSLTESISHALWRPRAAKQGRGPRPRRWPCGRPRGGPVPNWVLRNLTTRGYVTLKHRKTKNSKAGYFHVTDVLGLSLDKLLILKTLWSWESPSSGTVQPTTEKDSWAGHCFDVVHSHHVESGAPWHDVTGDIVEQAKVWRGQSSR